jgi:hypothetical protein
MPPILRGPAPTSGRCTDPPASAAGGWAEPAVRSGDRPLCHPTKPAEVRLPVSPQLCYSVTTFLK